MRTGVGLVSEVRVDERGEHSAWIRCEESISPAPGQYVMARERRDGEAVSSTALFASAYDQDSFLALDPQPAWQPGTRLELRSPLGRGFNTPAQARRVALVALEGQAGRLLPLAQMALEQGAAVVLYCDPVPSGLPVSLEAFPLAALPEGLAWADFIAADAHLAALSNLGALLGLQSGVKASLVGQTLVRTDMPCAGMGECGVCALLTRGGWKLVCKDGPVFDLQALDWEHAAEG
ncbi:MAG: hypothetical protein JSV61_04095 [Anaerolineales bacterium]|nr:MAG: hypothetical protein JSV61_04095 [Anaerolineales bacterium]